MLWEFYLVYTAAKKSRAGSSKSFQRKILPRHDRIWYKNFYELIVTTRFNVVDEIVASD